MPLKCCGVCTRATIIKQRMVTITDCWPVSYEFSSRVTDRRLHGPRVRRELFPSRSVKRSSSLFRWHSTSTLCDELPAVIRVTSSADRKQRPCDNMGTHLLTRIVTFGGWATNSRCSFPRHVLPMPKNSTHNPRLSCRSENITAL